MPWTNPESLKVGESVGGASGAGPLYTDANGRLLDPGTAEVNGADIDAGTVALAALANLAASTVIGRNTQSTGVPEAVTMPELAVLLQSQGFSFSVLQTFAASLGLLLTPGAAPGAPVAGQVWHSSVTDSLAFYTTSGKTRTLFEVGTFIAGIRPDTLNDWAPTYTSQLGVYAVFGPLMIVGFHVAGATNAYSTATGTLGIDGLPYGVYNSTAMNGFGGFTNITGLDTSSTSYDGMMPYGRPNTTRIAITKQLKGANPAGSASINQLALPASRTFDLRGMCMVALSSGF